MDTQEKEQGPDKNKKKGWREQQHNASGTKVRMEWNERRETRSWESTLTTNARTELLENQQRKEYAWYGLMEYISNYEVTTFHSREEELDW